MTILEGDRHKDEWVEMQRSCSDSEKSRQMTDQHDNATGIFTHVLVVVKCPSNVETEEL
jgi:hypothetical protein